MKKFVNMITKQNKQIVGIGMLITTCLLTVVNSVYQPNYNLIFSQHKADFNINSNKDDVIYKDKNGNDLFVINQEKLGSRYLYNIKDVKSKKIYSFCSGNDIIGEVRCNKSNDMYAFAIAFVKAVIKGDDPMEAVGGILGSASAMIEEGTIVAMGELVAECGLAAVPEIIGLLSATEGLFVLLGAGAIA